MKQLSIDEIKRYEIDTLKFLDKICRKYNLRYYLAFGTLIGAIRHNGFIPWDDDIDVMMPRKDFEQLIDVINQYSDIYLLYTMENEDYYYVFGKLVDSRTTLIESNKKRQAGKLGVGIDIFPLDGLPNNIKKATRREKRYRHLTTLIFSYSQIGQTFMDGVSLRDYKSTIFHFVIYFIEKIGLFSALKRYYKRLVMKYDFDSSINVYPSGGVRFFQLKRAWFVKKEHHKFEDAIFLIPGGYDAYLKAQYGNYMALPPENEQTFKHDFIAYLH